MSHDAPPGGNTLPASTIPVTAYARVSLSLSTFTFLDRKSGARQQFLNERLPAGLIFDQHDGRIGRRLAIRAAVFGPEADFAARAVGELPTTWKFRRVEKTRGH